MDIPMRARMSARSASPEPKPQKSEIAEIGMSVPDDAED